MLLNDVIAVVQRKLLDLMAQSAGELTWAESGPTVIMVVGVNGSGKTTSIAKLANLFRDQGKKVVLGARRYVRAAAVRQLTIWSQRSGGEIVRRNPVPIRPVSLIATARPSTPRRYLHHRYGRAITDANQSHATTVENPPRHQQGHPRRAHEVLLVLDATAGQNGISQAKVSTKRPAVLASSGKARRHRQRESSSIQRRFRSP
jgi:fused signal recognition particle receptor